MKKIFTYTAVVALLVTGVQADFEFGDVFKDLKTTESQNMKAPNTDFVFGDVFKDLKNEKESSVILPNSDFVFGDVFKNLK